MVTVAFHLFSYTLLFFFVGMIKPKWALFFLKEPTRFLISSISLAAFMIAMTVYGEGHRQETLLAKKAVESAAPVSEIPEAKEVIKPEVKETK
jgi:VIT1/CCC1 family predicted Fe2+/Mn2+ transporter